MWGGAASAQFARVAGEVAVLPKKLAMEAAFLGRLVDAKPTDEEINAAIDGIAGHPHGRIDRLSQWIGISSRQLQRRFATGVGYGPKLFHSILRFQRLLSLSGLPGMGGTHRKGYTPRSRARSATSGNPAPGYYSEM